MSNELQDLRDELQNEIRHAESWRERALEAEQQAAYYKQARRELLDKVERAEARARHEEDLKDHFIGVLARVRQVLINADEFGDEIDPDDLRAALEGGES